MDILKIFTSLDDFLAYECAFIVDKLGFLCSLEISSQILLIKLYVLVFIVMGVCGSIKIIVYNSWIKWVLQIIQERIIKLIYLSVCTRS